MKEIVNCSPARPEMTGNLARWRGGQGKGQGRHKRTHIKNLLKQVAHQGRGPQPPAQAPPALSSADLPPEKLFIFFGR